jgi:hypothetical protein
LIKPIVEIINNNKKILNNILQKYKPKQQAQQAQSEAQQAQQTSEASQAQQAQLVPNLPPPPTNNELRALNPNVLNDITVYHNQYDEHAKKYNEKNYTDYEDMYDMLEFKNSLFIYTANQTNSGPGNTNYEGGGTAVVSTNERAFGIITGHKSESKYGTTTPYIVNYQYTAKANNYIQTKPITTDKTVLDHIDDQIIMLREYIIGWNDENTDKITNIILPLENKSNELKLGIDVFKDYDDINKIGEYWLDKVLELFGKDISNLKSASELLNKATHNIKASARSSNPEESSRRAKTEATARSARQAYVPLDNNTIKKLQQKIAFINI